MGLSCGQKLFRRVLGHCCNTDKMAQGVCSKVCSKMAAMGNAKGGKRGL